MNSICIITSRYPTSVDKTAMVFVQQFAWALADLGCSVSVICPLPVNLNRSFRRVRNQAIEETYKGNKVNVFFPKYISLGQRAILKFNTAVITTAFFSKSAFKVAKKMKEIPEVFYGHFFTPSGISACRLAGFYKKKSFIGYGESSPWSINHYGKKRILKEIKDLNGIVSVSTKNRDDLIQAGIINPSRIKVFPNGYNPDRFFPIERTKARAFWGFEQDSFIVCFVGHFIERKGIQVLCNAIEKDKTIKLACAGKGPLKPKIENVIYSNPVEPEKLAFFYSAADVFVLPTLNEGCCNAIIEAIACGLPIISSNLPFNYDVLDSSNAILVNPMDENELYQAIMKIKDNPSLANAMREESLKKSKNLTINNRTQRILRFFEEEK